MESRITLFVMTQAASSTNRPPPPKTELSRDQEVPRAIVKPSIVTPVRTRAPPSPETTTAGQSRLPSMTVSCAAGSLAPPPGG